MNTMTTQDTTVKHTPVSLRTVQTSTMITMSTMDAYYDYHEYPR